MGHVRRDQPGPESRGQHRRVHGGHSVAAGVARPPGARASQPRNGYQFKDENDKAIADYNQSIKFNPGDARAFYSRGNAYSNKADHERAIADFSQAIALNPEYPSAFNSRCYEEAILGRTDKALADCNTSLRLRPGDAPTLDSRAFTYLKMRQWDKAVADYDAVLRITPGRPAHCSAAALPSFARAIRRAETRTSRRRKRPGGHRRGDGGSWDHTVARGSGLGTRGSGLGARGSLLTTEPLEPLEPLGCRLRNAQRHPDAGGRGGFAVARRVHRHHKRRSASNGDRLAKIKGVGQSTGMSFANNSRSVPPSARLADTSTDARPACTSGRSASSVVSSVNTFSV